MKLNLITTLFPIHDPARMAELRYCIEKNARNRYIGSMHFFLEGFTDEVKLSGDWDWLFALGDTFLVPVDHRPTYADYFEYANTKLAGSKVLICNTDIWYDDSLRLVHNIAFPAVPEGSTTLLAITRYNVFNTVEELKQGAVVRSDLQGWEVGGNCGSQDTWIFHAPIKSFDCNITVGVIGCDSFLAQRAQESGITVINPAVNIRTFHLHHAPVRNDAPEGWTYWQHPEYRAVCVPFCSA